MVGRNTWENDLGEATFYHKIILPVIHLTRSFDFARFFAINCYLSVCEITFAPLILVAVSAFWQNDNIVKILRYSIQIIHDSFKVYIFPDKSISVIFLIM